MKSSILALVLAAGLSPPALAQQSAPSDADYNAHHPEETQAKASPTTGNPQGQMKTMPGPQDAPAGMPSGMTGQGTNVLVA